MVDLAQYPLSRARRGGGLIFISGQLPINAEGILERGDIRQQTALAIDNLRAALQAESADLQDVIKVTAWLSDARFSEDFNAVYSSFFNAPYPTRSTVVATLLLPADIEIEAIALQR